MKYFPSLLAAVALLYCQRPLIASETASTTPAQRWTVERAQTWYRSYPWLVGANFVPSTAINQLEMWQ
ncbi:MAG TPA: 1,4-beta-xylanase, partial [Verrucomicrobiae bacterium]